jgi:hypothetical protein
MADNQMVKIEFDFDLGNVPASAKKFADYLRGIETSSKEAGDQLKILGDDIDKTSDKLKQSGTALKQTNKQWTSLALIIQDLPYGFRGIQNNLPALFGSLATGTGAAYFGFSALVAAITYFDMNVKKATETVTKFTEKTSESKLKISEMAGVFSAVRLGTLSARDATRMYNESLGDLFGKAKSVYEAEQLYIAKTEGYVKAQYFRAKADLEYEKAKEALAKKDLAYGEDQIGILGKIALATNAFFASGALQGVGGLYGTAKKLAEDFSNKQIELAGYETDYQEAQFNKRIAKGNDYRNKAFTIEKQYGIKSTTYQDDLDRQEEARRKKNLKEYQDNLKKTEKLMSEMRKREALGMNQGTTPIADSYEQDIKNAEKDQQDSLAFQLRNIKETSAITLNVIKERYQTEVSEAQGSYELIKQAQENMRASLDAAYINGSLGLIQYSKAVTDLVQQQNKAALDNANKLMAQTVKIGIGIMNALGPALDLLLEKGESLGDVLSKAFLDIIKKLAKVAIAAAITVAIMSLIPGLIPAGKGAATFGNLISSGMGLGSTLFGTGGTTGGDATKASNAINNIQTGQTTESNGQFVLKGNDLVLALQRSNSSLNLRRGGI